MRGLWVAMVAGVLLSPSVSAAVDEANLDLTRPVRQSPVTPDAPTAFWTGLATFAGFHIIRSLRRVRTSTQVHGRA